MFKKKGKKALNLTLLRLLHFSDTKFCKAMSTRVTDFAPSARAVVRLTFNLGIFPSL